MKEKTMNKTIEERRFKKESKENKEKIDTLTRWINEVIIDKLEIIENDIMEIKIKLAELEKTSKRK